MKTVLVLVALEEADFSNRYTERMAEEGLDASVGATDSCWNAS